MRKKDIALALASFRIAVKLMQRGRTAHSALKLSLSVAEQKFFCCNILGASDVVNV